jgi:hypothetical protein
MEGLEVMTRALKSAGASAGADYRLLARRGRVLCGLPRDLEVATRTLGLYQPQRLIARGVAALARIAIQSGTAGWIMPAWRMPEGGDGSHSVGVLVGSAGHLCDRAVTVKQSELGWVVTKHGFGKGAEKILGAEAAMLRSMVGRTQVPPLLDYQSTEDEVALTMAWQGGEPWRGEEISPVLGILHSWVQPDRLRALEETADWTAIQQGLDQGSQSLSSLRGLVASRFAESIRHGDLTRPNLRLAADGCLLVHDWERGSMNGIAGLDLVHYLTQDLAFRKKMDAASLVRAVHAQLQNVEISAYLSATGWQGLEKELMLATWAFNTGSGYLDQRHLMDSWKVAIS